MIVVNALGPRICVRIVTAHCSRWEIECIITGIVFVILSFSQRN